MVLTILQNISQWEGLSHILWKIKNVWNHQPELVNMLVFHDVSSSWATLDEQTDDIFHRILLKKMLATDPKSKIQKKP